MKFHSIAALVLLIFIACQMSAQEHTPPKVGATAGISESAKPIKVPPELRPHVPEGFVLRGVLKTRMSHEGETILLYDNDDDSFPEVHLHVIRSGKDLKLFDGVIAGVAGLLRIQSEEHEQVVGFAYHVGFDGADTTFVIYARDGEKDSYRAIFEQKTITGQMRIHAGFPVRFELWSADWKLDQGESCVWCPHRYRIQTFMLQSNTVKLTARRTSREALAPEPIAEKPFVVISNE